MTTWNQWRVVAYTGKRGEKHLGQTFVRADSEKQAVELGRSALRMLGVRGRYVVNARPYHPWHDISFIGFIAAVKQPIAT